MKRKLVGASLAFGVLALVFVASQLVGGGAGRASAAQRVRGCSKVGPGPALLPYVSKQLTSGQFGPTLTLWNTGDDCLFSDRVHLRLEHRRSHTRYRVRGNPSAVYVHRIIDAHHGLLLDWQWGNFCRRGQKSGTVAKGTVVYLWRIGSKKVVELRDRGLPRCIDSSARSDLVYEGTAIEP